MLPCWEDKNENHKGFLNKINGSFEGSKSKFNFGDGEYLTKITYMNRTKIREYPNEFWTVNWVSLFSKKNGKLEKILDLEPNKPREMERWKAKKKTTNRFWGILILNPTDTKALQTLFRTTGQAPCLEPQQLQYNK